MNFFHNLFLVLFNWTCRAKGACVPEDARGNEEESKEKSGRLTIPARVQLLVQLSFRWTVDDEWMTAQSALLKAKLKFVWFFRC
ncbi:hypothetical protein V8C43DRAFT_283014 [Trichoderma afarasin]